jgi:hypothetical protein
MTLFEAKATFEAKVLAAVTDDVLSVYTGKAGKCCCGCSGRHRYNAQFRDLGGRRRGYVLGDDEVNTRQVTKVLGLLKAHVSDVEDGGSYWALTLDGRDVIAYLVKVK